MGSPIKISDFKRRFRKYGVQFISGSKHPKMRRESAGVIYIYPFAMTGGGKRVDDVYEKGARKKLRLTPKDGVSDEDFYS